MSTDPDPDWNRTKLLRARCYDCGWVSQWVKPNSLSERVEAHEAGEHDGEATIAIDHENVNRDIDPEEVLEILDEVLEEGSRETDRSDRDENSAG